MLIRETRGMGCGGGGGGGGCEKKTGHVSQGRGHKEFLECVDKTAL